MNNMIGRSLQIKSDRGTVLVLDKITVDENRPVTAYLCLKEDNTTIVVSPKEILSIEFTPSEKHFFDRLKN